MRGCSSNASYTSSRTRKLPLTLVSMLLLVVLAACSSTAGGTIPTAPPVSVVQSPTTGALPPTPSAVTQSPTPGTTVVPSPTSGAVAPSPATGATAVQAATPIPAKTQTPVATSQNTDWTMYHRDLARTGYVPGLPDPQHLTSAWHTKLDGAVYAEPLVVGNSVLVATEGNTIYSLDRQSGQVQWKVNFGAPVPLSTLPCGNIDPLGITGTPVYDPATGLVFAVAEVSGPAHILVGVDAKTGEVKLRRPADPPGITPATQLQRTALALYNNTVYWGYGGQYGDCGHYYGWVVGAHTTGNDPLLAYHVPVDNEGGIWAPPGPVIDAAGHLFVSVGNSDRTSGEWDDSDSVLRLSPDLKREDGFAPKQWAQDNSRDLDLSSLAPVLLPDNLLFIAGKSGFGYLLHRDALGGVGGEIQGMPICDAYGGAAVVEARMFIPCNSGLYEVQVANERLTIGWHAPSSGSPTIGGNTVYSLDPGGTLYALDINTGKVRAKVGVGGTSRFSTPTLSGKYIIVGTLDGVVAVIGS